MAGMFKCVKCFIVDQVFWNPHKNVVRWKSGSLTRDDLKLKTFQGR